MLYLLDASSVFTAEQSLVASQANCRGDEVYSQTLLISYLKFEGNAVCQLGYALFFFY